MGSFARLFLLLGHWSLAVYNFFSKRCCTVFFPQMQYVVLYW
ncbi:hypothetical protein ZOSMA_6G02250 [Zostera marina]|uniref:Uncharacterized protein n=1 Tax=Zostera marina TaxID=29655 RepID=A0A0K9NRR2_ZOSMR|nr:hypothetical protein ZOSMA_6G02250 [Zostera marina]